jgi:hypothetical protein
MATTKKLTPEEKLVSTAPRRSKAAEDAVAHALAQN